ncbi:putative leucine-rich repeat receptor-like protein kinase [Corchorus capsularis]|uniref:Putative leucine-rich repeat receptor-like protein kinase n=1 Tax=Corchorus capsularis TaxID=210143 RepID=A0A1R3H9D3_COCAP|nr:putative leucine-rich repeat receptor-like protein kinase [Corchorus capsularis]
MSDRVFPASKPAAAAAPPAANGGTGGAPAGGATTTATANGGTTKSHLYNPTSRLPYRPQPHHRRHHHRPRRNYCCCCCFWTILIILILALLVAITGTVLYVLYRPHRPSFTLASLRINRLNLTTAADSSSSHLSTMDTRVTVKMDKLKSKKVGIRVTCDGIKGVAPKAPARVLSTLLIPHVRLRRLDLSHNHFQGQVPMGELTQLPNLLTLRLEDNLFNGTLNSIASFSTLLDFNVSNNNFNGEIPSWMSHFGVSSFQGNKELCGQPLPSDCVNRTALAAPLKEKVHHRPERNNKKLSNGMVVLIIAVDAVAVAATLATITWCCYKYRCFGGAHERVLDTKGGSKVLQSRRSGSRSSSERQVEAEELVVFEGCKGFRKVGDLLKSSAELLGKGSVGTTYKVVMESGDAVVVKRVRQRRKKDVDGWLRMIGGLRHSNIEIGDQGGRH